MTAENEKKFKSAQWRFIFCSMIAYAFFYVTRQKQVKKHDLTLQLESDFQLRAL